MKKLWLLSLTTVLALGSLYLVFEAGSAKADPNEATKDILVQTQISGEISLELFNGTGATVELVKAGIAGDYIDGMTGGVVTANAEWKVRTSNTSGYTLVLDQIENPSRASGAAFDPGHLMRIVSNVWDTDANATFDPHPGTPAVPDFDWDTNLTPGHSYFGYAIVDHSTEADLPAERMNNGTACGVGTDLGGHCWTSIATQSTLIDSSNETAQSGDTVRVEWRAEMVQGTDYFLKNGTYQAYVRATATNKP